KIFKEQAELSKQIQLVLAIFQSSRGTAFHQRSSSSSYLFRIPPEPSDTARLDAIFLVKEVMNTASLLSGITTSGLKPVKRTDASFLYKDKVLSQRENLVSSIITQCFKDENSKQFEKGPRILRLFNILWNLKFEIFNADSVQKRLVSFGSNN